MENQSKIIEMYKIKNDIKSNKNLQEIVNKENPENIVVFDSLDTLQTYAGAIEQGISGKKYYLKETAKAMGYESVEEMTKNADVKTYLRKTIELQNENQIIPVIKQGVEDVLMKYIKMGYTIVVGSADLQEGVDNAVKELVDKGYIAKKHVHGMISQGYGNKKEPETWERWLRAKYPNVKNIAGLYEDTEKNLEAGMIGLKTDGFHVNTNDPVFKYKFIKYNNPIYREEQNYNVARA